MINPKIKKNNHQVLKLIKPHKILPYSSPIINNSPDNIISKISTKSPKIFKNIMPTCMVSNKPPNP